MKILSRISRLLSISRSEIIGPTRDPPKARRKKHSIYDPVEHADVVVVEKSKKLKMKNYDHYPLYMGMVRATKTPLGVEYSNLWAVEGTPPPSGAGGEGG